MSDVARTKAPSAEYFDTWYADTVGSQAKDEIQQRHLGLPSHVLSTSSLTWDAVGEVCTELRLAPGQLLLDLACGRGGYGFEVSARTQARLVGVDFSGEAVSQASKLARQLAVDAQFAVGDLAATGLGSGSVDAVMCIDSIQFAVDPTAAYAEIRRVLNPGGRVVMTCWEPVRPDDDRLVERLRIVDLDDGLRDAGFNEVEVRERPAWRAAELAMWAEAADLDPGDDLALLSFKNEAVRVLATASLVRRVLAVATAPLTAGDA